MPTSSASSSTLSSEGHGPIFGASELHFWCPICIHLHSNVNAAYNPHSGHALPFPSSEEEVQEAQALVLWTPPPNVLANTREDNPSVVAHLYEGLGMPCGVRAQEFWGIFEKCNGCGFIVLTTNMKTHICDLTGM